MGRSTARRDRRSPRKRSRSSSRCLGAGDSPTNVPSLTSHSIRPRGRFWAERQAHIFFSSINTSFFYFLQILFSSKLIFTAQFLPCFHYTCSSPDLGRQPPRFPSLLQNFNLYQKPNWIFFLPVLSKVTKFVCIFDGDVKKFQQVQN